MVYLGPMQAMRPFDTSVYVHFPWCAKRCPYCDFATRKIDRSDLPHRAYADAVLRELWARKTGLDGRRLASIFFGGGTPSLWQAEELGRVLQGIREAFGSEVDDLEISVECNPNSLDRQKALALASVGVNRISLGVQSMRNDQLRFLGRLHDREEALGAIAAAQEAVPRVSADLMFGMPKQSLVRPEVEAILATGVEHVSAYALTIEQGTQFGELQRLGKLEVASDERYAGLFTETENVFAEHGFEHYEVSNYARPGQEARHNLHYWQAGDYLGLGAAAVGCLRSAAGNARRWRNAPVGEDYIAGAPEAETEDLGADELIQEGLMLGLRLEAGLDVAHLEDRAGRPLREGRQKAVDAALAAGDLVEESGRWYVPRERWLRLDGIVASLF